VTSVPRLGSKKLRLSFILAVLNNSKLKLSSLQNLNDLKSWLASIDFALLEFDQFQNGFDAVRSLSFSDINCTGGFEQTWPAPSKWADDLQLTQMCNNLLKVEVDVSLSNLFLQAIQTTGSMAEAMALVEDEE
jgi:hypothetical protein